MRHFRLSASGGDRKSIGLLIDSFELGILQHGRLAETLQVMYSSLAEMRSEDRDEFVKHLLEEDRKIQRGIRRIKPTNNSYLEVSMSVDAKHRQY